MGEQQCKNPTCTAPVDTSRPAPRGGKAFCSRRCQLAMRTRTGGRCLGDIWVSQDLFRLLKARADVLELSVRDLVVNLLEQECGIWEDPITNFARQIEEGASG